MKFTELSIKGVWLVEPHRFGDDRGYFAETFRADIFAHETGIGRPFVQDNESMSRHGVLRGLHYQAGEHSQAKLVRVTAGKIVDVAVDLRKSSPTFGQHVAIELSAENGLQLYIPRGFAHGFTVLSDYAQFQYKVDNAYCPGAERCIRFDDPALAIEWPMDSTRAILSPKDLDGTAFAEAEYFD